MSTTNPRGAQLIIICGLSFSGKTTLGKAIIERFGYEEVDVDETKTRFYGQNIRDEDLLREDWVRIYTETDQQVEDFLKSGRSVVDASRNFSKAERNTAKSIADRAGAALITVYVDTPESIARKRLLENRRSPHRRDVSDPGFEDVIRAMQPPTAEEQPLIFHYRQPIEDWLLENAAKFALDSA